MRGGDSELELDGLLKVARVPAPGALLTPDELLAKIRAAVDARVISDDYAHTLSDLVEMLAEDSR